MNLKKNIKSNNCTCAKKLNRKQKLFCHHLVLTGNTIESASLAGFKDAFESARKLMSDENVIKEIEELYNIKRKNFKVQAYTGYERLAFGKINDAIKLMFSEKPAYEELKKMDLFCVSEIRRLKDGAMEIKFFDKLKAMEKLENDNFLDNEIPSFYEALKGEM